MKNYGLIGLCLLALCVTYVHGALGDDGDLYVGSWLDGTVNQYQLDGTFVGTVVTGAGNVIGFDWNAAGDTMYLASNNAGIYRYTSTGTLIDTPYAGTVFDVAVDSADNVWFTSPTGVLKYNADMTTQLGSWSYGTNNEGISYDPISGNIFVGHASHNGGSATVVEVALDGTLIRTAPVTSNYREASTGPDGKLYAGSWGDVIVFARDGLGDWVYEGTIGTGGPSAFVCFDPAGNMYATRWQDGVVKPLDGTDLWVAKNGPGGIKVKGYEVPEPATILLLSCGIAGLIRRKKHG